MTEPSQATPTKRPTLSAVWLIPLGAALIGLWLVYSYLSSQGPSITLVMEDAEGIKAGKTPIKTRNVQVGTVESVSLSDNMAHTLVTVSMQADADRLLAEDSRFWVVKPRIGREGISGLNTVLSGSYIELLPGDSQDTATRFQVSDTPPVEEADSDGLYLNLTSQPGNNVSTGDPVSFRNLTVGRVIKTHFDPEQRHFEHRIFIKKPYDVLVTRNCRFWSVHGVGFQLNSEGFQLQMHSLETLLGGGIAFAVPGDELTAGDRVGPDTTFTLYPDRESARRGQFDQYLDYVLLVEDSVRGLQPGAPVEYRGVRVGTVEDVPWQFGRQNPENLGRNPIPVRIRLEPQRLSHSDEVALDQWRSEMGALIEDGLRASLRPGNLLTGALFVDIDFHDQAPATGSKTHYQDLPVFPTVATGLAQIESQVRDLLKTINELPLKRLFEKTDRNLDNLAAVTQRLEQLLSQPALEKLPDQLDGSLQSLQQTLEGLQPGSPGYQQLQQTLERLNSVLRDAQPLMQTLRDKPNALFFSSPPAADPQPKAPE